MKSAKTFIKKKPKSKPNLFLDPLKELLWGKADASPAPKKRFYKKSPNTETETRRDVFNTNCGCRKECNPNKKK